MAWTLKRRRGALLLAALGLIAIVAGACGGGGEPQDVELTTVDGIRIAAEVREGSDTWVLLAHQWPNDRTLWTPIADRFRERGYSVLIWDARCHGESECTYAEKGDSVGDNWRDWNAALDFAVAEGASAIYAIGASMGGTGAVQVAADRDEIVAIAALSSPNRFKGLDALENYERVTVPRLFIVGAQDVAAPKFSQRFHQRAAGPSRLVVFDTDLHGNRLAVSDEFGERVQQLLLDFVEDPAATVADTDHDTCMESIEAGLAGEIVAHGLRTGQALPQGILDRLAEMDIDPEDLEEMEVSELDVVLSSVDLLENRPTILDYSVTFVLLQPGSDADPTWAMIESSATIVGSCIAS